MENCIFCKIVKNEIPSYKIYEDEFVYSFLDISQSTPGHTLIVPKKHFNDIYELDVDYASKIFSVIPNISNILKHKLNCDGINIVSNNGVIAGQTVEHFHIHLIPRYLDDSFNIDFNPNDYNKEKLDQVFKQIKNTEK